MGVATAVARWMAIAIAEGIGNVDRVSRGVSGDHPGRESLQSIQQSTIASYEHYIEAK
jgi:hypothetical protein